LADDVISNNEPDIIPDNHMYDYDGILLKVTTPEVNLGGKWRGGDGY